MPSEQAFVDTNVFLRFITDDIPEQADAAERLFGQAVSGEIELITTSLAIAEIIWTLGSYYRLEKATIRDHVLAILNTPGLRVDESEILHQAMAWYDDKNIDFVDAYHAAWLATQDVDVVYTFGERHFRRITELEVRVPRAGDTDDPGGEAGSES
jgi:predicted nucleic acid-binding protein